MKTKKPDYVTREAERFRNTPPGNRRRSDDVKALLRRVLRRAARECERQKATEPWTYPGGEEARERFNQGCDWSRDAIRALATGGRG